MTGDRRDPMTAWPWRTPLGAIEVMPVSLPADLAMLHAWVTHPRSHFWGMQGWAREQVAAEFTGIAGNPYHDAWILAIDGEPIALSETYRPQHSPLDGQYPASPGDLGMHVLVAPPRRRRSGTTAVIMTAVLRWCFRDPLVQRVVVEPDVRNHAIHAKNLAAGFRPLRTAVLPDKTALISAATRADFEASALAHQLLAYECGPPAGPFMTTVQEETG